MIDPKPYQRDWKARGFSFGIFTDPPGQRWEDFVHETDELWALAEGDMELVLEGTVLHPQLGEEVFIPARAVHSVRTLGPGGSRWFYGYRL